MKNLFDHSAADEVMKRIGTLRPDSPRQWGTMAVGQMVAHCSAALEMATGDQRPPRMMIGRLIGGMVKRKVLGDDAPFRHNSPTSPLLVVRDDRDLAIEQTRLQGLVRRFAAGGPAGCTTHPHTFFGKMTPTEWAILMYKHLDHHLRQFGA